ncbi:nuclear transport factor 2 family protein [uncultured Sphingomonas sp.]|uniref:nuclear transport factor 2 family protein n=1 Tax=uncultured Sphingomonas sp. TaxID=158754 RepID=UPI0035CA6C6C
MRPRNVVRAGKKLAIATGVLALCGLALGATQPSRAAEGAADANRRVVLAFYEAGLNRKNYAEAARFLGERYVQHNPMAEDGREGFAKFVGFLRANYPGAHSNVRQAFADGDFVILHVLEKLHPGDRGNAIVDIFRLERGRIVEHWDVKQPIPDQTANRNGMF